MLVSVFLLRPSSSLNTALMRCFQGFGPRLKVFAIGYGMGSGCTEEATWVGSRPKRDPDASGAVADQRPLGGDGHSGG